MPQRIRRFNSPAIQGDDSWVEFRPPTRGEARALPDGTVVGDLILRHLIGWNWVTFGAEALPIPTAESGFDGLTQTEIEFLIDCVRTLYGLSPEAQADLKG
jgi:hypothetical protein